MPSTCPVTVSVLPTPPVRSARTSVVSTCFGQSAKLPATHCGALGRLQRPGASPLCRPWGSDGARPVRALTRAHSSGASTSCWQAEDPVHHVALSIPHIYHSTPNNRPATGSRDALMHDSLLGGHARSHPIAPNMLGAHVRQHAHVWRCASCKFGLKVGGRGVNRGHGKRCACRVLPAHAGWRGSSGCTRVKVAFTLKTHFLITVHLLVGRHTCSLSVD